MKVGTSSSVLGKHHRSTKEVAPVLPPLPDEDSDWGSDGELGSMTPIENEALKAAALVRATVEERHEAWEQLMVEFREDNRSSVNMVYRAFGAHKDVIFLEEPIVEKVLKTIVTAGQMNSGSLPPFDARLFSVSGLCPGQMTGNALKVIYAFYRAEAGHREEIAVCYSLVLDPGMARIELGYFLYHYK